MDQYYQLGVKAAALARRESKVKATSRKRKRTMYEPVGNQQDPYRYGQKVKTKNPSPPGYAKTDS